MMNEDEFRGLIARPESNTIMFKESVPSSGVIARDVSAIANAEGGSIVYGVNEDGDAIGIRNPDKALDTISKALNRINPPITVTSDIGQVSGRNLLKVDIDRGDRAPYLANGVVYVRQADKIVPMSSGAIVDIVRSKAVGRDELINEVQHLSVIIEALNADLIAAKRGGQS